MSKIIEKFKLSFFISPLIFGVTFFVLASPAKALSQTLTTSSDWNSGTKGIVEADTKEGELKLQADGTWGARSWHTPNFGLTVGAAVVSDGTYIYATRGNADNYFARYSPERDEWTTLASLPKGTYYGADMEVLGDYIYIIFGGYQREFARYSISRNSWELLSNLPDLVNDGGSLATDGTNFYALKGNYSTDFYKYTVATNSWAAIAGPPATIFRGSDLVKVGNYFYTPRGINTNTFYRYDYANNTWTTLTSAPGLIYDDVNHTTDGTNIFVSAQNGTNIFYKYDVALDTWSTLTNAPDITRYVGVVYHSGDGYIYFFRGNGQYDFWKYDIAQNQFLGPAQMPLNPAQGSDLIYSGGYFYGPRGANTNTFYRYDISGNSWTEMTVAPGLFNDDTKGVATTTDIYFYQGSNTTEFWRYNIAGNSWQSLAATPFPARFGATLAYPGSGNYIYGTRGVSTLSFWRYSISENSWDDLAVADLPADSESGYGSRMISDGTDIYYLAGYGISRLLKYTIASNTWSEATTTPFAPYYGTDIVYNDGKIIAMAGWYKTDFWEYTIATNTWRPLKPMAGYYAQNVGPWAGASLEYDGAGSYYLMKSNGRQDMLIYTPSSYNYPSSSLWTSPTLDFTYVSSWGALSSSTTTPSDSSVTFQTRSSNDNITWTSWENVSGETIPSTPQRYLQVRVSLNSSLDRTQTPILNSLTVNYVGDTNPPTNPNSFTGSSQQIEGIALTSGESYRHTHPYFTWSGASDTEQSVAGYYVYFGGNTTADPVTDGSFQTASTYNVTTSLGTGTYYLKIKTKDIAGNISDTVTGFTYEYIGISPTQSLLIDESSEFTGEATNTSITGDQIKLASKAGFWLEQSVALTPAGMQYGAKTVAYVASSNKMYVFRGDNTPVFYEYDVASDVWTAKADAPASVRIGGGVIEGPEGYLYGMPGNNSTSFWRYDIAADTWSDADAADMNLTTYYGASLVYDGSQFIYLMRGNNDDAFFRYDTLANSWEESATLDFGATSNVINNFAYLGADLAIDQNNQLIYAIQGNLNVGFSVYDVNTNDWTVLTNLPLPAYLGASLEFDSDSGYVYYTQGNSMPYMYKYNPSTEVWSQVSSAPLGLYYGSNIRKIGDYFYVIRGSASRNVYKYHIAKDSWLIPSRGLFGTVFLGSTYFNPHYGSDLVKGDGNYFYLTRGNNADDFVRWDASNGTTTRLATLPTGITYGSSMAYDNINNKIYLTGGSYIQRFYVYDIATDTWSTESSDPYPADISVGSSMVFDGSRYIYLARGNGTATLYRFDTQGSSGTKWTTLANAPAGFSYGAELLLKDGYIYTLRGSAVANNPFYRYEIATNTWSDAAVADLTNTVYNDGFLVDGNDGYLYAARAYDGKEFYRYSIANDQWSTVTNSPAQIYYGASGESNGSDKIYMNPGIGTNSIYDGLYTYIVQTENSSFEESGTYISPAHDLSGVYQWANLRVNFTTAQNSDFTVQTRGSEDNESWSTWQDASDEKTIGTDHYFKINSPTYRYLQVKFTLTSTDGIYSGAINDYSLNFFQDLAAPTNPSTISSHSDNTQATALITDTWNYHSSPYFDWPDAEETGGASDTSTGSGVAGYYVYFGTSATADPEVDGVFQTSSNYTPSSLISDSTYYLRIKAKDNTGNIASDSWAPFIYKFDAVPPSAPSGLGSDPSGYSAINSFDFSWSEASASGAVITGYCYKTGASEGSYATDQCTTSATITDVPSYRVGTNTFYVRTQDIANNYSAYTSVSYYYVDADNAPAPPSNLEATPTTNTSNSFAFTWDPPLTGTFFGSVSNLSYYYSINAIPTAYSTSATSLTYLNAGAFATLPGDNVFYLVTKDEAGNINYNNYVSTTFTANTTSPGIPLNIDIADVSVKATSSWKLAISWEAPADVGSGVASYAIFRSTDGVNFNSLATSGGISFVDVGLTQQAYYYKVKACDSTNNCGAFSEVVTLLPDGKFVVPANLTSDPVASSVTTKKAIVSWSTDRTADSKIAYGLSSGDYLDEEVSNSTHVTSHILTLTNLSPGTTYYYVTKWTDEDGNTGTSAESTFETAPPPSTEEPITKSTGLESALIEFVSKNAAKVKIYYGESSAFGGTKEVVTGSVEGSHTVEIAGLKDGTKYYYKINSFDNEGEEYEGEIHSFETLPRPKITDIKVNQVKGTAQSTLLVDWTSNTKISSIITYFPTSNPDAAVDQVELDLKSGLHRMLLTNLLPQTSYSLIIKGKDFAGNQATSQVIDIITAADTRPPQITDLKAEGEILGVGEEATAQLVVSFKTDEPGTAQIEYGEGSGTNYAQKTQEDGSLTNHHLVIITGLTPSKVYHLRALSKDKADNLGVSLDKAVITPKATENALDLVVTSMSEIFGFLKTSK